MKGILNKTKVKLNKKDKKGKISKKQTKGKNKKSLKSFKRIQKGGVISDEVFYKLHKTNEIMNTPLNIKDLENLIGLVSQFSEKVNPDIFWTYEYNPPDYFLRIRLYENPYAFYISKNPNFIPVNSMEPKMTVPEFQFIIAKIIKDLLVSLFFNKMPQLSSNNENAMSIDYQFIALDLNHPKDAKDAEIVGKIKETIFSILIKIAKNISEGFIYIDFIDYLCDYINLYSGIYFYFKRDCFQYIEDFKQILNTPFIILPTFVQIDYKKVLNLIRAPLLNFRLSNSRKKTHNKFTPNCFELFHDILFHCDKTHNLKDYIKLNSVLYEKNNSKLMSLEEINEKYYNINLFFDKINDLYNYQNREDIKKYAFCYILFYIFHEFKGIKLIKYIELKDKLLGLIEALIYLNLEPVFFNELSKESPISIRNKLKKFILNLILNLTEILKQ